MARELAKAYPALGSKAELQDRRFRKIRALVVLGMIIALVILTIAAHIVGEKVGTAKQAKIDKLIELLDSAN